MSLDPAAPAVRSPWAAYCATPSAPHASSVVVLHELFGLSEHVRDVCRRLADAGHAAMAPDLFVGARDAGTPDVLDETPEGRDAGFALLQRITMEDVAAQVEHAVQLLPPGRVDVLGLSVGGHLAYRLL